MKLLLVDDEWFTRDGIMESLPWEELGIAQVEQADDGVNALEVVEQFQPDILLTDVRMPRMTGTELAYAIRERFPSCYIIFMSGFTDKEYMKAAINVSATAYVEKPIQIAELKAAIEKAVLLARRARQIKDMEQHYDMSIPVLRQELAWLLVRKNMSQDTLLEFFRIAYPELPLDADYATILIKPFQPEHESQENVTLLFKTVIQTMGHAFARDGLQMLASVKDDELVVAHCCLKDVESGALREACLRLSESLNKICESQISIGIAVSGILQVQQSYAAALASYGELGWKPGGPSLVIADTAAVDDRAAAAEQPKKNPLVSQILTYIDDHYAEDSLSLQQISEHMYLTPSYMCVIFKDETNITINQYIATARIEKAKEMLRDSRVKVKDVAVMVGYNDSNYFAKIFKKHTGLTPVEFRELANR